MTGDGKQGDRKQEMGDSRWEKEDRRRKTKDRTQEMGSLTSYKKKFSAFNLVGEFVNFKERLLIIENINLQ